MSDIWGEFIKDTIKYILLFGMPIIPAALLSTQDKTTRLLRNCGIVNKDGNIPKLIKKETRHYGYDIEFKLPAGICLSDFEKQQQEIEQYLDGEVQFEYKDRHIIVKVHTGKLEERYDYEPKELKGTTLLIGMSRNGLITLTLDDENPHLLIAGMTGSGKSMLLRSMIVNLILTGRNILIHLADLKAGAEFGIYEMSSAITTFTQNIEDTLELLKMLDGEMMKRYSMFRETGVVNIEEYSREHKKIPEHVLFIDEFANIAEEDKECLKYLKRLLRMARACGIHIILCTQRPDSQTVPGAIKNNVGARIALYCSDPVNSRIIIDSDKAAYLTGNGHGILHTKNDVEFRGFYLETEDAKKLIKHTMRKLIKQIDDTSGVISLDDYAKR